jgi:hypothetical protein
LSTFPSHRVVRCAVASASSRSALPAVVISPPSLVVLTTPESIVQVAPVPVTVISPLSPSVTPDDQKSVADCCLTRPSTLSSISSLSAGNGAVTLVGNAL